MENTGVSRAVNEMLLTAFAVPAALEGDLGDFALQLFPFIDPTAPAAFTTLLARGGFAVSASYSNETRAVASPVAITAAYVLPGEAAARCSLVLPAGWQSAAGATVSCGGAPPAAAAARTLPDGRAALSFTAPAGVPCLLAAASE